jgi:hypothetical protein
MLKTLVPVDSLSNALCCVVRDFIKLVQVREPLRNPPHVQPPFSAAAAASLSKEASWSEGQRATARAIAKMKDGYRGPDHASSPACLVCAYEFPRGHHDEPGHREAAIGPITPVLAVTPELCS